MAIDCSSCLEALDPIDDYDRRAGDAYVYRCQNCDHETLVYADEEYE